MRKSKISLSFFRKDGVSFAELLVAISLLGTFGIVFFRSFNSANKANKRSELRSRSIFAASNYIEILKGEKGIDKYYGDDLKDGEYDIPEEIVKKIGLNHRPESLKYSIVTYNGGVESSESDDERESHIDGIKKITMNFTYSEKRGSDLLEDINEEDINGGVL